MALSFYFFLRGEKFMDETNLKTYSGMDADGDKDFIIPEVAK